MGDDDYRSKLPATGFESPEPVEPDPVGPEPIVEPKPVGPESAGEPASAPQEPTSDGVVVPLRPKPPAPVSGENTPQMESVEQTRLLSMLRHGQITLSEAVEMTRRSPALAGLRMSRLLKTMPGATPAKLTAVRRIALTGSVAGQAYAAKVDADLVDLIERAWPNPAALWSPAPGWPWHTE